MSRPDIQAAYRQTVEAQFQAAMPEQSAWVAANAGSGKTRVLTDRVMRLLLAGTEPARILSITFTKAAAAEMAERLFRRLGEWALLEDEALKEQLTLLDGKGTRAAVELSQARKLFARALETPGGLKIQTIHSFCESVLKRFPLEAGVPPGAKVLEEHEAQDSLHRLVDDLARHAFDGDDAARADFILLTSQVNEDDMRKDLFFLAAKKPSIDKAMARHGGERGFFTHLAKLLEVDLSLTEADLQKNFADALDRPWLEGAYSAYLASGTSDVARGGRLRAMLDARDDGDIFSAAREMFIGVSGAPFKIMADKGAKKHLPDLNDQMKALQAQYLAVADKLNARKLYEITAAFYRLALRIGARYSADKLSRGWLDFDDLILKVAALFQAPGIDWVLYKLDQGIDHILVDEAQDTSRGQWQVIMGPLAEFFAGEAARGDTARTVFVVGDEKQSIYSFQGADAGLFRSQQSALHDLVIASEQPFLACGLNMSFRSTAPVLEFVDEVFSPPGAAKGVCDEVGLSHFSWREGMAGQVTLWPLVEREEAPKGRPWDLPVDMPDAADPTHRLATHIATTIRDWLETGEDLASRERAIRPGDIMILCQRRGPLFHQLVRELIRLDVPTAGSDRLRLYDHVGVKDLLAAARFILQHGDDLSLAEVLKSPLFGFGDAELFRLAWPRGQKTLWQALAHVADGHEKGEFESICRLAVSQLRAARSRALLQGAYGFFSCLLEAGAPSGWQRFYRRLGPGAREPLQELLNEALSFEESEARTLQGFISFVAGRSTELKKEVDGAEDLVRIMTVHGSKGLEAEIVFLADAAYTNFTRVGSFLPLGQLGEAPEAYLPEEGFFVRSTSANQDNDTASIARAHAIALRAEEYRRLFYVAATRARDRLYLCGVLGGKMKRATLLEKAPEEASWYALAASAFARLQVRGSVQEAEETPWPGHALSLQAQQTAPAERERAPERDALHTTPAWLEEPAPPEQAVRRLSPSHLAAGDEEDRLEPAGPGERVFAPLASLAPPDQGQASSANPYTRGNMLHLLLEKLPAMAPALRKAAGQKLLHRQQPDLPPDMAAQWLAEVLVVLDDPAFAHVFGPGSQAEVSLMGVPAGGDGQTIISGQIDRLCVSENEVLVVDYKTNRPPPTALADVPPAYITQLAAYRALLGEIYPGRKTTCALLWTWEARLMPIPPAALDDAFARHIAIKGGTQKA